NPLGVSAALQTVDDHLLLGQRSAQVAYYPNRIHPIAGAVEPADAVDLFMALSRELHEEVRVEPDDIREMACLGIVEDPHIRQPEVVVHVITSLPLEQLKSRLDPAEHSAPQALPITPRAFDETLANAGLFTPVALGTLLLLGRVRFGQQWFDGWQ